MSVRQNSVALARKLLVLGIVVVLAAIIAGCHGGSPPTHYYAVSSDWAIYLAWTEDTSGRLQGQVQVVGVDPSDPAKMRTLNGAFTGTRNGEDISIVFPLLSSYAGATWTGTLKDNAISLVIPTAGLPASATLVAGSFDDFQEAAQKIQTRTNVAQQQQARQQAIVAQQQAAAQSAAQQQDEHNREVSIAYNGAIDAANRLRNANTEVSSALNSLAAAVPETPPSGSLSARYAETFAKMQSEWEKEQAMAQVSPLTCYQKGQVQYVAGQVSYWRGQVQYLDDQSQYTLSQVQQYFGAVNNGLLAIDQWAPVYYQKAQAYSQLSGKPNAVSDPTADTGAFRKQTEDSMTVYSTRVQHFQAIIKDYDDRAVALEAEAKRFPEALTCSG